MVAVLLLVPAGCGKITDSSFRVPAASVTTGEEMIRDSPKAALTFDDGPHVKYPPRLLDELRKRGIRVTFFLMGKTI